MFCKIDRIVNEAQGEPGEGPFMNATSAAKFDPARAAEYETQSRIALAGYDACHDLAACILSATLGRESQAKILVAGAGGTANEILVSGKLEPHWRFLAVDPSQPMLDLAMNRVAAAGLTDRAEAVLGHVADLPASRDFDAATLIGVLHHLPGEAAKLGILRDIALRLKANAPLVLAGNCLAYASEPLFMATWGERWRMHGASDDEIQAKLGKILQGADPPTSEDEVARLLDAAGFQKPKRFFSSLFWGAWITHLR
jgi:tRNA (cmo5U34)-methyltransferase